MSQKKSEMVLKGIAASPGVAHGRAWVVRHADLEVLPRKVAAQYSHKELARLEEALVATRAEIMNLKEQVAKNLGEAEAQIFEAHLLVLEDRALIDESIRRHRQSLNAIDYCFKTVAQEYLDAFSKINDEYIRERAADIRDVTRRVLQKLTGAATGQIEAGFGAAVLVSDLLTPSDTAGFEGHSIEGIVTSGATRTSHALIMARTLGIPAVVGVRRCTQLILQATELIVDGHRGLVILNPSDETSERYAKVARRITKPIEASICSKHVLADNKPYTLVANIDGPDGIVRAKMAGAQGIGLLRSEMIFFKECGFPSEEQQFEIYKTMAQSMGEEPLVIRTLDVGGDKPLLHTGYFENNPLMGLRGIRFCLAHPVIFRQQLRAILRASVFGNVRIMIPFVSTISELEDTLAILQQCRQELLAEKVALRAHIPLGVMIEVPSAAIMVSAFCERCDFISIGSNDLIQWIMAVDRMRDDVAYLYQPEHPAVLHTIRQIVTAAKAAQLPVSICGEMAADPRFAMLLVGMGISALSVSPVAIPKLTQVLSICDSRELEQFARCLFDLGNPKEILGLIDRFYEQKMAVLG